MSEIALEGVSKHYGAVRAVDGVSFRAAAVLALGTNLALAQDQFMDPYWKLQDIAHAVQPAVADETRADLSFVDRYPAQ